MDYTNTRYYDISCLGTSTSQNKKVDASGTKPDTTGDVPDAKGTSDKKIPQSHSTKIRNSL